MSDHQDMNQDDLLQQAVNALRQTTVPNGPSPEDVTRLVATLEEAAPQPSTLTLKKRTFAMKPVTKIAVAATILMALGSFFAWTFSGGAFTGIALANVADALDSLRSATYEVTSEAKGEKGQPSATATGKGFFLAPSHQRMEISVDIANRTINLGEQPGEHVTIPKTTMNQVIIFDGQAAKLIMLMPDQKVAMAMDMKSMEDIMKKSGKGVPPDLFEMVRRLVREGSSGTGEKAEKLGTKEIDGHAAVGFRTHNSPIRGTMGGMTGDMTLWADPETARPIRIESAIQTFADVRLVMNNFRYDVELDPSLFSLEPPEGYSTQAMEMTMPVEEDLLRTLRKIAEHSEGMFPAKLGMNKDVMESLMTGVNLEMKMDTITHDELEAAMDKIAAKYGGKEKLREKYGKNIPPEIMAEIMKAGMPNMQEQIQKLMQKQVPFIKKRVQLTRGITFYMMLKPENDPHYAGKDVKLGTPDRPILWYKPTGTEKYRVIYADLSVKEVAPEELKGFPEASDP